MVTQEITPKIERLDDGIDPRYAKYVVEPLVRGYGTTLGNSLRRVLLSSIPGAAIASVRIEGVLHEFSTIPGVVEDVTELILNLKDVAVRTTDGGEAVPESLLLRVERKGKGELTAADIDTPPELEIVNRGHHIATLTSDDASLSMEMQVRRGTGYVPAEEQDRSQYPLGTIPVDCIFSPVRKVSYRVEPTRVGRLTNYDRLILEVLTNGTISPGEAVSEAAKIIDRYLLLFFDFAEQKEKPAAAKGLDAAREGVLEARVEDMGLSVRAVNCLLREGIQTVRQLVDKTEQELMSFRAFGRGCLNEVQAKLRANGLSLKEASGTVEGRGEGAG